jgi:hypothetical protein
MRIAGGEIPDRGSCAFALLPRPRVRPEASRVANWLVAAKHIDARPTLGYITQQENGANRLYRYRLREDR